MSVQQLKFFTVLTYILENDHKIAQNIDFGVTNKFQQIGKFTNTESMNNEDRLYLLIFFHIKLIIVVFRKWKHKISIQKIKLQ